MRGNAAVPKVFVLLGRSGAGKTETGSFIGRKTGLPVLELANVIRKKSAQRDPLALEASGFINRGRYFPESYSRHFILEEIKTNPAKYANGFILDGFPRTLEAARGFEKFLGQNGFVLGGVLHYQIPRELSFRRQRERRREPEESLESREREYVNREMEVIRFFRSRGLVKTVVSQTVKQKRPSDQATDLTHEPLLRHHAAQAAKMIRNWQGVKMRGKNAGKRK